MNNSDAVTAYLNKGYRLDDLQVAGLKILQNPQGYCFTGDPVLLANFCRVKPSTRAADIGSGSGIIGLLLVGKYGAASCDGFEVQAEAVEMSRASVKFNKLEDKIKIFHSAVQEVPTPVRPYDLVVSNPPYTRLGDGNPNGTDPIAIARHEIKLNLDELAAAASRLTKFGGSFCLVHQAERLSDVCVALTKYGFAPKRIRMIEGRTGLPPTLFLMEAIRCGKSGLTFLRNLTLYREDGSETEELSKIYGRQI